MKAKSFFISFAILAVVSLAVFAAGVPLTPNDAIIGMGMATVASFGTEGTYAPDKLLAGDPDMLLTRSVTIPSGTAALLRGALLGKITLAGASETHAGNTGNGVMTLDATNPVRAGAKQGVYKATLITAAANGGTFRVEDPDGAVLGDVAVGATFDDDIKFVIADGATDFIVGDTFLITIAAGSGKYILSLAAAIDGSQVPDAVLMEDCDASAAEKITQAHFRGDFNVTAITFGTGHTAASVREVLRGKGINLVTPGVAA